MSERSFVPGCFCDDMREGASWEKRRELYDGTPKGLCGCDDCSKARIEMFWVLGMSEALVPHDTTIDEDEATFSAAMDAVLELDPRFDC